MSQSYRKGALEVAVKTAFDKECSLHPVRRLVLFGHAVRDILPKPFDPPWPPTTATAANLDSQGVWRLCGDAGFAHRRVGQAELHFLAADVAKVGDSVQVELPASHIVHWTCGVRQPDKHPLESEQASSSLCAVSS